MRTRAFVFVCAMLVTVLPATADVIYDNGGPIGGGWVSDTLLSQFLAEDFVLAPRSETITDIHWWGQYDSNDVYTPDDFTIMILGDDNGLPDSSNVLLNLAAGAVNRASIGVVGSYFETYEYWVDIAPLTLTAGETYYLAIYNNSPTNAAWGWATTGPNGSYYVAFSNLDTWVNDPSGDLAFYLTNDNIVPEPASMTLLGLGLAGLAVRMRRRKA